MIDNNKIANNIVEAFMGGPSAALLESYNYMLNAKSSLKDYSKNTLAPPIKRDVKQLEKNIKTLIESTINLFEEAKKY